MSTKNYPIKVIQFGEGNFLRAFIEWMITILNEQADFRGSVAVVQPLPNGMVDMLDAQKGGYHLLRQGFENGAMVDELLEINCISKTINPYKEFNEYMKLAEEPEAKLVFSNTTEAGIVFDSNDQPSDGEIAISYPGKLTQLLLHRYKHFNCATDKGLSIVPCELIEHNGTKLKACIDQMISNWNLTGDFKKWVNESCHFANTLVDRIVPGYPKEEIEQITERIGKEDKLVVKAEAFHLFVIDGHDSLKNLFPAHKCGLNVKFVNDITPYRTQKVRILNGAHTSMVSIGILNGKQTVREAVEDEYSGELIKRLIYDEIVPTISIPGEDPKLFAEEVITRFTNPHIHHELKSIALNSISKFKVRVLPTFFDSIKNKGKLPEMITLSLAGLIYMYLEGDKNLNDDQGILGFFKQQSTQNLESSIHSILSNTSLWDTDLSTVEGLHDAVKNHCTTFIQKEKEQSLLNY